MSKRIKSGCAYGILALYVIGTAGCLPLLLGAAAGAGGYAWVKGSLIKEINVSTQRLYKSTIRALKKMDMPIHEDESDRLSATVASEFADGKDVKIEIEAITERTAQIKIRVGIFGDKLKSELIMNTISKYL